MPDPQFQLSLGAHARLEQAADGLRVFTREQEYRFRATPPALTSALERLNDGGITEDTLCEEALQSSDASSVYSVMGVLRALDSGGALRRRILVEGKPFATLVPQTTGFHFQAGPLLSERRHELSRFAYVRKKAGVLVVQSATGRARLELHESRAAAVVMALAEPSAVKDLEVLFPDLGRGNIESLLLLLHNTEALAGDEPANWWEFHDMLFHMRSRRGRHDAPYGGTFRHGNAEPPLLVKPKLPGESVPLFRPDLEQIRRTDPPFADVLERRRSIRRYAPEPVTAEQLGEFLFRSVRYQRVLPDEKTQYALRPTPAGGALHELEIYAVVANCNGLDRGLYHYRPLEHELTRIAPPSAAFERLIQEAWTTADRQSPLNVLLPITARCRRVFWKYESMAYALILKNLGALYTTMYLAATAMDLAPCALGGGNSELFAAVAGLDPYEEPAVGEFILGSRARN